MHLNPPLNPQPCPTCHTCPTCGRRPIDRIDSSPYRYSPDWTYYPTTNPVYPVPNVGTGKITSTDKTSVGDICIESGSLGVAGNMAFREGLVTFIPGHDINLLDRGDGSGYTSES